MTEEQNKTLLELVARLFPENEIVFDLTLSASTVRHKLRLKRNVLYVNPLTKEDPFRQTAFLAEMYYIQSSLTLELLRDFKVKIYPTITEQKIKDAVNHHTRIVIQSIKENFIHNVIEKLFPYSSVSEDLSFGHGFDAEYSPYATEDCELDINGFLVVKPAAQERRRNEIVMKR